VAGIQDDNYAIYADLFYSDGSTERVTATFPTGTHDYITQESVFTPSKPINNFTFVILLAKDGTSYFHSISFQEKVPGK
jgi:hypothetical protein